MHMRLMCMSRLLEEDGSSAPRLCVPQRYFCRTDEVALARNETASQHSLRVPSRRSDRRYRCFEGTVCCERFVRGQEGLPTRWGAAVNGRVQQHLLNLSD